MEEYQQINFEDWIKTITPAKEEYYFEYDENGIVVGMHPYHVKDKIKLKIQIEEELAVKIHKGEDSLKNYFVDIIKKKVVKKTNLETSGLTKIDDVLHRIVERKWSNIQDPDIFILHKDGHLEFNINTKHVGTIWEGETELLFLITGYNDPNFLKKMVSFRVGDLVEGTKKVEIDELKKFSIYTRRVFDQYTVEHL